MEPTHPRTWAAVRLVLALAALLALPVAQVGWQRYAGPVPGLPGSRPVHPRPAAAAPASPGRSSCRVEYSVTVTPLADTLADRHPPHSLPGLRWLPHMQGWTMVGSPGIPALASGYVCPTQRTTDCVLAQGTLLNSSDAQQLSAVVTTDGLLYIATQRPGVSFACQLTPRSATHGAPLYHTTWPHRAAAQHLCVSRRAPPSPRPALAAGAAAGAQSLQ